MTNTFRGQGYQMRIEQMSEDKTERTKVLLSVPDDLLEALDAQALLVGTSRTQLILMLMREFMPEALLRFTQGLCEGATAEGIGECYERMAADWQAKLDSERAKELVETMVRPLIDAQPKR